MADENQRLYATVPFASTGFVTYRCLDNYRSPQRIARFLQALLPISFVARNPTPGDPVHVHEVAATAVTEVLATRIERLLDVGYTLAQIVVLTGKGQAASEVMGAERIGRFPVRRFVGFTADGSARYTAGDLRIETLWRFKGQQAPAVLVCELDGDLADQSTVRRLYCAATRASMHLEILVARGSALLSPLHPAAGQANAANMA